MPGFIEGEERSQSALFSLAFARATLDQGTGGLRRRHVLRTGGPVDRCEQRIVVTAAPEQLVDMGDADAHPEGGLMASEAAPAVGAERLEEGIVRGLRGAAGLEFAGASTGSGRKRQFVDHGRQA